MPLTRFTKIWNIKDILKVNKDSLSREKEYLCFGYYVSNKLKYKCFPIFIHLKLYGETNLIYCSTGSWWKEYGSVGRIIKIIISNLRVCKKMLKKRFSLFLPLPSITENKSKMSKCLRRWINSYLQSFKALLHLAK